MASVFKSIATGMLHHIWPRIKAISIRTRSHLVASGSCRLQAVWYNDSMGNSGVDMYSNVSRSDVYIGELCCFIRREYGLEPTRIVPAKRGFFGETWRLETADLCYFVKLDYSPRHWFVYERSFPVVEHIVGHGIDFISRVVHTKDGRLSVRYDGAVLGVFHWIDGENIETDETKLPEYRMLAKVYAVAPGDLSIPQEDFTGRSAGVFFAQWAALEDTYTRSLFEQRRETLEYRAARLKHFASLCRGDTTGFVITHGDAGGNLIQNGDEYYLVDWDDPLLAPPERDAWNMLCYGKSWAGCIFHQALRESGINYTLRPERIAYYCYFYCFTTSPSIWTSSHCQAHP